MAEIIAPQKSGKRKLQPPLLDLTPMVDLGFILITFFIFTTTLAKPQVMKITMPSRDSTDKPSVVIEESVITLIPVKNHNVLWYEGSYKGPDVVKTDPIGNLRQILIGKRKKVAALPASFSAAAHKMYVIIKPNDDCKYADLVKLLDGMIIINITDYTLMDLSPEEKDMLSKK